MLDLGNCNMRLTEVIIIANSLCSVTTSLTALNLANNNIGTNGITAIANALVTNNTLTWLNLSSNNIDSECIESLCHMLRTNKCLKTLRMCDNDIKFVDILLITGALCENNTLSMLFLKLKYLSDTEINTIADILIFNYTITLFGQDVVNAKLTDIINRNKKFFNDRRFRNVKVTNV